MSRRDTASNRQRFSEAVVRSMQHAQQLSMKYNHAHLGSEHLLAGALIEESGAAVIALKKLGADPQRIKEHLLRRLVPGTDMVTGSTVPGSACLIAAFETAGKEAGGPGGLVKVEMQHLLIGLACSNGVAAELLRENGVTAGGLRGGARLPMSSSSSERGPAGNGAGI